MWVALPDLSRAFDLVNHFGLVLTILVCYIPKVVKC